MLIGPKALGSRLIYGITSCPLFTWPTCLTAQSQSPISSSFFFSFFFFFLKKIIFFFFLVLYIYIFNIFIFIIIKSDMCYHFIGAGPDTMEFVKCFNEI
jgi:hypothetical protein